MEQEPTREELLKCISDLYDLCENLLSMDMARGAYTVCDAYTDSTSAMDRAEEILGL